MDLLTLLSVCTLGFDPKLMQGIAIVQSGGNPHVYKIEDRIIEFDSAKEVIAAARAQQEKDKKIRIGIMGVDIDLLAATAQPNEAMFEPCVNVNIASRRLKSFKERCEREGHKGPESCAVSSYMGGGYEARDETHLDRIMIGALTGNQPNPEIKGVEAPLRKPEDIAIDTGPLFFKDPDGKGDQSKTEEKGDHSLFFD